MSASNSNISAAKQSNITKAPQRPPQQDPKSQTMWVASSTNKVMVHEVTQSTPHSILNESNKAEYKNWNIWNLSWAHDNQIIVFCEEKNNKIIFSKSDTGAFVKSFTVCDEGVTVVDVCYSSDSKSVAFGCSDGTVCTLDLKTRRKVLISTNHSPGIPIQSVQFNNNDTLLASASVDGLVCVQVFGEQQRQLEFSDKSKLTTMKFSIVKSSILATAYETGQIIIWDVATQTKKLEFNAHISQCTGLAFSPLNNMLLCSCGYDGKILFYDITNGKNVKSIETQNPLSTVAFCQDGHTIAVGSYKGKVYIYDLKEKQAMKNELKGQEGKKINCLHFQKIIKETGAKQSSIQVLLESSSLSNKSTTETVGGFTKTLAEVQNTTQSSQQMKSGSKPSSQISTPISGQINLKTGKISSNEIDEKTIKYIEEQKIDNTKRRLEQELQQLQEKIKESPLQGGFTQNKLQQQTQSTSAATLEIKSQESDWRNMDSKNTSMAQNHSNDKMRQQQSKLSILDIPNKQVIKEDKREDDSDDELMNEFKLKKRKDQRDGGLAPEIKSYIEQVLEDKAQDFQIQLQNSINNLHIELIRNFQIQEDDLRQSMESLVSANKKRRKELKYLREENKKLRQISY